MVKKKKTVGGIKTVPKQEAVVLPTRSQTESVVTFRKVSTQQRNWKRMTGDGEIVWVSRKICQQVLQADVN